METIGVFLSTISIGLLITYLRIRYKESAKANFLRKVAKWLIEDGFDEIEDGIWQKNSAVYKVGAGISPLLTKDINIRLAVFSDSFYEFELTKAHNPKEIFREDTFGGFKSLTQDKFYKNFLVEGMVEPELEQYLLREDVKAAIANLSKRWDSVSKMYIEMVAYCNNFYYADYSKGEFKEDLANLYKIAKAKLSRKYVGGGITFRDGFEKDMPSWHWKNEDIPKKCSRFVASFYIDNPLLNTMALEAISSLAGNGKKIFLVDKFTGNFLKYSFGECFSAKPPFFECENFEAIISADYYTNGSFFKGFIGCDESDAETLNKIFSNGSAFNFHKIAVDNIDKIHFFARRLFDDTCDWFSGEYEILTTKLTKDEVTNMLKTTAKKFNAQYWEIERPFYYRLFRQSDVF